MNLRSFRACRGSESEYIETHGQCHLMIECKVLYKIIMTCRGKYEYQLWSLDVSIDISNDNPFFILQYGLSYKYEKSINIFHRIAIK